MKTAFFLLALSTLSLFACKTNQSTADSSITKIVRGTSFGHCRGYCIHETTATPQSIENKDSSRDEASNPAKTETKTLSVAAWKKLVASFTMADFQKLEETIGCPDCADGGAEWIEIHSTSGVKKVTFEFGRSPAEIEKLTALMKAQKNEQ